MDPVKLACGDNISNEIEEENKSENDKEIQHDQSSKSEDQASISDNITVQTIEDHESKLKDRITQCKNVIESLKFELNAEKAKLEKESKHQHVLHYTPHESLSTSNFFDVTSDNLLSDLTFDANKYSASVENKLNYDENLMEYEKQLQKYQNTLNLAQMEKKNAIRKQMLTKAYRLKLLEVENQCNIELLRVKQSLQCLEPLQMIVNKWKSSAEDSTYDLDNYELMPRFPELSTCTSSVEINSIRDELECENVKNVSAD